MEGSKEWLVVDDWTFAKGTIEDAKRNLAFLQQDLTPLSRGGAGALLGCVVASARA